MAIKSPALILLCAIAIASGQSTTDTEQRSTTEVVSVEDLTFLPQMLGVLIVVLGGATVSFGIPFLLFNMIYCGIYHPTIGIGEIGTCISTVETDNVILETTIQILSLYAMMFYFDKIFNS